MHIIISGVLIIWLFAWLTHDSSDLWVTHRKEPPYRW